MHYIQSKKLVKMVEHAYNHVPLYKKRFDEIGLLRGDIQSIEDVKKLPVYLQATICAIIIPLVCLPCQRSSWFVFMRRPEQRQTELCRRLYETRH